MANAPLKHIATLSWLIMSVMVQNPWCVVSPVACMKSQDMPEFATATKRIPGYPFEPGKSQNTP